MCKRRNGGFIFISILFFTRYISKARREYEQFIGATNQSMICFQENCKVYQLTSREIEIVELIKTGHKIAEILFISERTLTTHVQNIYQKIEVSSKVALIHKLEQKARLTVSE